jgi:hypothetical protein
MIRQVLLASIFAACAMAACSEEEEDPPVKHGSDSGTQSGSEGGTTTQDSGTTPTTDSGSTGNDTGTQQQQDTGSPGPNPLCATYCNCMTAACATVAPADCVNACAAQTTWDLNCRAQHCGYAQAALEGSADRTLHCGHGAGGNATCQ